jgi:transcriptional regulator of met regulon
VPQLEALAAQSRRELKTLRTAHKSSVMVLGTLVAFSVSEPVPQLEALAAQSRRELKTLRTAHKSSVMVLGTLVAFSVSEPVPQLDQQHGKPVAQLVVMR